MMSRLQLQLLFGHQLDVVQFREKLAIRITSFATTNSNATHSVQLSHAGLLLMMVTFHDGS